MPRFVTDSRPMISAQHPVIQFYREEFLKHQRCLQQQRPYYSESAITDVETALAKIMGQLESFVGSHPLPGADSERAGRRAIAIAESVAPAETLLVLLSGGASALMAVPAESVTLDDKRKTTEDLLRGGADIHSLNVVRKH